jgi:hypothetical protein
LQCDQVFARKHRLNQHLKEVHSNTGSTACQRCGKSVLKRHLTRHLKTKSCNK